MSVESVGNAKRRYEAPFLAKKNVVAVGIGYKEVGGAGLTSSALLFLLVRGFLGRNS